MAKTINQIALEVVMGKWGSGTTRQTKITAAGYNYQAVQAKVNELVANKAKAVKAMNTWATKIANDNSYHYKLWVAGDTKTHKCPICSKYPVGKYHGWNCIGFAYAVWHHGGGLPCACNCHVISNDTGEALLNAKTDAEALKIAKKYIGLDNIIVIRNSGKVIPKSKWQAGDIGLQFNGNKYVHTFYYRGDGKITDSTGSNGKVANDKQIATRSYLNYSAKIIIRYLGDFNKVLQSIDVIAQEVLDGKWGSGDTRKQKLTVAGYDYNAVQAKVNELVKAKEIAEAEAAKKKAEEEAKAKAALIEKLAQEVLAGKWGSGDERKKKLVAAGYDYDAVQKRVNELLAQQQVSYSGTLPSLTIKKSNAEVIEDTIKWALWIAGDNNFHYGYTSADKKANAHHNGCYFCGTQRMKKNMLMSEHTYCCNPFVGAAWAHGGCVPAALKLCQNTNSWNFSKGSGYDKSSLFDNLGHPAKSQLKKGDVLCRDTHVALYIGDGKIVQAGGGDDNKKNSARWNKSISVSTLTDSNYKNFPRVHRFNGSVNTTMNIRHGEVSKRVSQWQAFLDWYFDGKVGKADGYYGDNTLKWTKKFQEEVIGKGQGDGIIGPKTLEAAKKVKK